MAGPRIVPQIGLEDEVLTDADVIGAMKMLAEALMDWEHAEGAKIKKAVEDARAKLFALMPQDDGNAHNYRIGQWTIAQSPPGEERDTHVVPKNPTRRVSKVVADDEKGGASDE